MRVFLVHGGVRVSGQLLPHFRRDIRIRKHTAKGVAQAVKAEFGKGAALLALTLHLLLSYSSVAHDVCEANG